MIVTKPIFFRFPHIISSVFFFYSALSFGFNSAVSQLCIVVFVASYRNSIFGKHYTKTKMCKFKLYSPWWRKKREKTQTEEENKTFLHFSFNFFLASNDFELLQIESLYYFRWDNINKNRFQMFVCVFFRSFFRMACIIFTMLPLFCGKMPKKNENGNGNGHGLFPLNSFFPFIFPFVSISTYTLLTNGKIK